MSGFVVLVIWGSCWFGHGYVPERHYVVLPRGLEAGFAEAWSGAGEAYGPPRVTALDPELVDQDECATEPPSPCLSWRDAGKPECREEPAT